MRIIGITGRANAGKDSVAGYLCQKYGYTQVALADPLKVLGAKLFGFSTDQLWGPSNLRNTLDPRFTSHFAAGWSTANENLLQARDLLEALLPDTDIDVAHGSLLSWFGALKEEYTFLSPRIMLQSLGTEWGRQVLSEDVWVRRLMAVSSQLAKGGCVYSKEEGVVAKPGAAPPTGIVVSDVRFENELHFLRNNGGLVFRIRRSTDREAANVGIQSHASEMEQDGFAPAFISWEFSNHGTLEDLFSLVDECVSRLEIAA